MHDVYAIGNALVDIQVQVPDSVLKELGCEKGCRYLTDHDRQTEILDSVAHVEHRHTVAGGSAANTVNGIAQMGGRVGFSGTLAHDRFGSLFVTHMQQSGIAFAPTYAQGKTGSCVVLITDDAARTMFTNLGVSDEVDAEDINKDMLAQSRFMYVEGYFLETERTRDTLVQAIAMAKENNVSIALTASDVDCVLRHRDQFETLIQDDVDLLLANALEAQALTRTHNVKAAIQVLSSWCNHVAVTDGAQESLLSWNGEVIRTPAVEVSAKDTTGAGDAYAAGLLYGMTHDRTPQASGAIASLFAAHVVAQMGPHFKGDLPSDLVELL